MINSYGSLLIGIKGAIREKALEVPRFAEKKEGCIRVTSRPFCEEASRWLGASAPFDPGDAPLVEDAYVILPGGSRVARFENDDGSVNIVDTYAVTTMKIAQLCYLRKQGLGGLLSTHDEHEGLKFDGGYANWRGALCCEIDWSDGTPFALIYISVSGASQDEDITCAAAAIDVIGDFFAEDEQLTVLAPIIGGDA